jgi:mRNA interferase MazF
MHYKDFDSWNKEKQIINQAEKELFFSEREIWWCALGINVGVEIDGKNNKFERPVLIMKFISRDMSLVLPLTSKGYEGETQAKITTEKISSFVKISQIKVISTKRLLRKMDVLSEEQFYKVYLRLIAFILPKYETRLLGGNLGGRSQQ